MRVPADLRSQLAAYMVAAGPPGFTALALINLGDAASDVFPDVDFGSNLAAQPDPMLCAQIFSVAGIWLALLLMGMASKCLEAVEFH